MMNTEEARELVERLTGHTPGPWLVSKGITGGDRGISTDWRDRGTWLDLACVVVEVEGHPSAIGEANAALIAAAPDLHAALTAALDEIERLRNRLTLSEIGWKGARDEVKRLRAAIRNVADQALSSEIPDGYGPSDQEAKDQAEFNRGYDAAIQLARAALERQP